jgi:hypothetical protein
MSPQTFKSQPDKLKVQYNSALPGSKEVVWFLELLKETKGVIPKTIASLYYMQKSKIHTSAKQKRSELKNIKKIN